MIGTLIMTLFHARTTAHVLHLKTHSFAAHKALNEFYDGIVDLADSLAEAYQGCYGIIDSYPAKYTPYANALDMLAELRECIDECAKKSWKPEDTHLNNLCDEIRTLIASTQYKIKNLK